MSYFDDDPDPEFRTPDERAKDEEYERQALELAQIDHHLDAAEDQLERLAFDDPVGLVWFGQSDEFGDPDAWIDSRVSRNPRK